MSKKDLHIFENPIELIEGMWPTPLLKLSIGKDVWAKLEFYNPFSHSIKDRTALYLFKEAIKKNAKAIVEATSGNTGIALSALSSIFKINFTAFIPSNAPNSFKVLMKVLGANVISAGNSTTELLPLVKQLSGNGYMHLDQFNNEVNVLAHYETTAREIDEQTKAIGVKVKRIIATMGTAGHIAGIAKYFKEKYNDVEIIGVEPAVGERIPGIKRTGDEKNNKFLSLVKIDRIIDVTLKEAIEGVICIARNEGILIGLSAGATVSAYKKIVKEYSHEEGATILIFPDDAFKYVKELEEYV